MKNRRGGQKAPAEDRVNSLAKSVDFVHGSVKEIQEGSVRVKSGMRNSIKRTK